MRYILTFAAIMALLTSHVRADETTQFTVVNKVTTGKEVITTTQTFTVINKTVNSGPGVAAKQSPKASASLQSGVRVVASPPVVTIQPTPAQAAGLQVQPVRGPGSSVPSTQAGSTPTNAPAVLTLGGTSSPCANGKCPTSSTVEYGLFGRRRK